MKPIFSANFDPDKNAILNWRMDPEDHINNFFNIADGYMQASIELAELCLKDNKDHKADKLIFPILNNVNHGIELYLKGIDWILIKLTPLHKTDGIYNKDEKPEGIHDLKKLLKTVKTRAKNLPHKDFKYSDFEKQLENLQEYIDELTNKINAAPHEDKMDFSRYSVDKKTNDHFYILEKGNIDIDLENFVERFEEIKETLNTIATMLDHHHDQVNEGYAHKIKSNEDLNDELKDNYNNY